MMQEMLAMSSGGGGGGMSVLFEGTNLAANSWNDTGVTPSGLTAIVFIDSANATFGWFEWENGSFTTLSNLRASVRIGSSGTIEVQGTYASYTCKVYG